MQPYYWRLLVLLFDSLILTWILIRFDLLTVACAVFTFAFWWGNYPLLVLNEAMGAATEQWLLFGLCGAFVLAAAAVVLQSEMRAFYRRLVATLE